MATMTLRAEKSTFLFGSIGAVLGAILLSVFWNVAQPKAVNLPDGEVITSRDLRFADLSDGGIAISDGIDGSFIGKVEPGEGGFLRGTLRGLVRERRLEQIGSQTPFRISLRSNNSLILEDPATGRWIDLRAFGTTNTGAFLGLLQK